MNNKKMFALGFFTAVLLTALISFALLKNYEHEHISISDNDSKGYSLSSPIFFSKKVSFGDGLEKTVENPKNLPLIMVKRDGKVDVYSLSKNGLEDVSKENGNEK